MSLRLSRQLIPLGLGLLLSACSPSADGPVDEQKNPHYHAGKERLSALDYKGAIGSFERAIEDNPRSALAHYELGVLFDQHENDYAAALYHYNKAIKLRPSGYPSDNIRQRIPACKQELIKEDSLAVINPSVLRETERLREENQTLRRQLETLQAYHANRAPASSSGAPGGSSVTPGTNPMGNNFAATEATPARSAPATAVERARSAPAPTPGGARPRTHSVRAGETLAAVARQYQVRLPALLAANPGLDPKRLRVGQVLNLPGN